MTTFSRNLGRAGFCLLVLLVCGATPASAAWIGYRNDAGAVIVVQGSSTGPDGQPRRGQPHQMNPRETTWDPVQPGMKTITITDPQTNNVLWQGPVNVADKDLYFSVQTEIGPDKKIHFKFVPATAAPGVMPTPPRRK